MKNKLLKTVFCFILSAVLLLPTVFISFAAETNDKTEPDNTASEVYSELKKSDGNLLCVSKYGDTNKYPENSAEAVLAAAEEGADIIYVNVRKTADNYIVLMTDDNLSRMCVDSLGNPADKSISEVGYHELSTYHLRAGTGYLHETITSYNVPTLQETIEKLSGKAMLLISGGWDFRDEIYDVISSENALSNSIIIATGDKKEVSSWLAGKSSMPLVMSSNSGNGSAKSYVSKTLSAGCVATLLSAKNPYSSVFKTSVQSKFEDSGRSAVDMTVSELCGGREDNTTGWNDITKRGFSIIITNDPSGFIAYRDRVTAYRELLSANITKAQNIDTTLCSTASANKLKKTVTDAKKIYVDSMSENEVMESNYTLRMAMEGLTNRTDEADGKTVTKGRIIAVVLVVLGLGALEIVFETVRRKKIAKRRAETRRPHSPDEK